jgi:hypothetical protein
MDSKRERNGSARRKTRAGALGAAALCAALLVLRAGSAAADVALPPIGSLPPITVGVGLQTSAYSCSTGCIYSDGTVDPGKSSVQGFELDSIRLYVNGSVTDTIKLTFNTEYNGATNNVGVLDAIGRFEFSDQLNIWAGRFLPPSDRANLYGPYYANDWAPYADGVADFYPDVEVGRDNGIAYWGQFGILKVQVGAFDGESLNSAVADKSKMLAAGRLTLDFWDPEPGYYYNATYYGGKDLLAVGLAAQTQDSKTAWSLDGLMEKKLPNFAVVTVEAEFQKDNGLVIPASNHGWYGLGSYLFAQQVGIGKFQVLGKYSQKTTDAYTTEIATSVDGVTTEALSTSPQDKLKTAEFNLNYIIKTFNARVGFYYLNQKDDLADTSKKEYGLKLQLQM